MDEVEGGTHIVKKTGAELPRSAGEAPIRMTGREIPEPRAREEPELPERERRIRRTSTLQVHKTRADPQGEIERGIEEVRERQRIERAGEARAVPHDRPFVTGPVGKKQVAPMKPIGEFLSERAGSAVGRGVSKVKARAMEGMHELGQDLISPARTVARGRSIRRQQAQQRNIEEARMADPMDSLLPKPRRPSRKEQHMGTGFLFSEGIINPRKGTRGNRKRTRDGYGPGDFLI